MNLGVMAVCVYTCLGVESMGNGVVLLLVMPKRSSN